MKILFVIAAALTLAAPATATIAAESDLHKIRPPVNSGAPARTPATDDTLETFKAALNGAAQKALDEKNAVLTPESEKILNKMIASAARRLKRDRATEKTLEQAKESVTKFTLAMVENGKAKKIPRGVVTRGGKAPSFYTREVDAKAVKAARGVCPLYPICN